MGWRVRRRRVGKAGGKERLSREKKCQNGPIGRRTFILFFRCGWNRRRPQAPLATRRIMTFAVSHVGRTSRLSLSARDLVMAVCPACPDDNFREVSATQLVPPSVEVCVFFSL